MINIKDQSYLMVRKILYSGKFLREKTFVNFVVLWLFTKAFSVVRKILYSGKILREKTFANFVVLWLFTKAFSVEFGGVASFAVAKESISAKVFSYF